MKKLLIGLVVVALALAVVLGVQVGQGNKLRTELEDQRAKVAALEPVSAEAEELKKQVTALTEEKEKELKEAEDASKALAAEAEAAKGKVTELEQQLKAAQDEALSISGERDALNVDAEAAKGKVTELEKQMKAAQDERLVLVGERDTLSVESEAAKGMAAELEKQLKDAQDQLAAVTSERSALANDAETAKGKVSELEGMLKAAQDEALAAAGQRDALTAELAAAQKNQEDLTAQIAALNDPKIAEGQSKLEADYSALLSQVNDLTQKDQEGVKKQAELETALKTAQDEVLALQETVKGTEAARDEALAKLAAAETAAADMKAELEGKLTALEGKLAEAVAAAAVTPEGELELTLEELAKYNGKDGQRAYIAVDGIIYDVTDSRAWKDGQHNGFEAGKDLTEEIKTLSPHGVGKLEGITQIGKLKAE